ncbi:hypothetical protein D5018_20190 [Parashewanella curva]|uniref:Uncharacterized protein n=1 Tax=Parashewanella curva TaxID=2338552 RepID=A0A3L8PSU1_9GAMM|nr:hypothetical protein [Parashewanella curva]RLV57889.1 hypothetical protein D5018_20190 [Parashewanella curva]
MSTSKDVIFTFNHHRYQVVLQETGRLAISFSEHRIKGHNPSKLELWFVRHRLQRSSVVNAMQHSLNNAEQHQNFSSFAKSRRFTSSGCGAFFNTGFYSLFSAQSAPPSYRDVILEKMILIGDEPISEEVAQRARQLKEEYRRLISAQGIKDSGAFFEYTQRGMLVSTVDLHRQIMRIAQPLVPSLKVDLKRLGYEQNALERALKHLPNLKYFALPLTQKNLAEFEFFRHMDVVDINQWLEEALRVHPCHFGNEMGVGLLST